MLRKTKAAPPTFRAGLNFHDPSRSGYARVSILDHQDLFPNQGTEFPDDRHKPPTKSYLISSTSPFTTRFEHSSAWREPVPDAISQSLNTMLKTEQVCNRVAARAIAAPTDGEIRPLHSQIAAQAVQKERETQLRVREQLRLQQMKDDDYWANVEREQGIQTRRIETMELENRRARQRELANDYQRQFELHTKRLQEEKEQDRQEAERLKQLQREEEVKEQKRQQTLRLQAEERKKEFEAKNAEILMRRQKRIEDDLEEERRIQAQYAEVQDRMAEREAKVRKAREDATARRERLIAQQSQRLAELKAKENRFLEAGESEVAKREEARRLADEERKRTMTMELKKSYNEFVQQKDLAQAERKDTPDFTASGDEDFRKADERMRAIRMRKLRLIQQEQARERRERERREREEEQRPPVGDTMYFLKDNEW